MLLICKANQNLLAVGFVVRDIAHIPSTRTMVSVQGRCESAIEKDRRINNVSLESLRKFVVANPVAKFDSKEGKGAEFLGFAVPIERTGEFEGFFRAHKRCLSRLVHRPCIPAMIGHICDHAPALIR